MSLFKSEEDRNLWIKLNAERQIEWEKGLTYFDKESGTYKPTQQALNHRTMEGALEVSKNQLEFDEKAGKLRYSLEDLLVLNIDQLNDIDNKRHLEWIRKFESL